MFADNLKIGES